MALLPVRLVSVGVASGLLVGCTSVTSPKLTVASAAVGQRSAEGLELAFAIDGENSNDTGLPLRTVKYTVELGGERVFEGTRSPEATLRRMGVQRFVLPAVVKLADHPELASGGRVPYRVSGEVTYVAPGQIAELLFDAGVRVPTTSFSDSGELDLGS
ncbi:MAG: LEA type 2 family protein [Phycisphaerales bacterium]|nr:LEA type 2 family protein [Phycisphaerales bacterium]